MSVHLRWLHSTGVAGISYSVRVGNFKLQVHRRHGITENWHSTLWVNAGCYWSNEDLGTLDLVKAKREAIRRLRVALSGVLSDLVLIPVEEEKS